MADDNGSEHKAYQGLDSELLVYEVSAPDYSCGGSERCATHDMSPADRPGNSTVARPSGKWSRPILVFVGCLALLGVLGWVDDITGYELGFFVFYSLPVGLAAWYLGRWPAVGMALAASATWWLADFLSGEKYSSKFYFYWNTTIHFLAFVINAVTIAKIKSDLDRKHQLAAELESAREALRALASTLPACPVCGAIREQSPATQSTTPDAVKNVHPDLEAALCPDCRVTQVSIRRDIHAG